MLCLTPASVCLYVAYIGPKSRIETSRKTKIGTEVAHVTHDSDTTFKVKGQGHQVALVGCTGRPTWTYSNCDLSVCVHDVYRVTTCRPGRGHIVAAARLQLVFSETLLLMVVCVCVCVCVCVYFADCGSDPCTGLSCIYGRAFDSNGCVLCDCYRSCQVSIVQFSLRR